MYTQLSQDTGMELDYEMVVTSPQAGRGVWLKNVWRRFIPKLTKTREAPCAQ